MAMTKNVVYILPEIGVIVQETALRWCELLNLETLVWALLNFYVCKTR